MQIASGPQLLSHIFYCHKMATFSMNQMLRSPRLFVIGVLAFCCFLTFSLLYGHHQSPFQSILTQSTNHTRRNPAIGFKVTQESLEDVRNSTLGVSKLLLAISPSVDVGTYLQFQKIFVINLPERTDKLDQFVIVSSLADITADVIEGVKGKDVQNKSLPALEGLPTADHGRDNIVGCWRAHMNFART